MSEQTTDTPAQPTSEDMEKAQKVSTAMVEAADQGQDAMVKAGKQEADKQGLALGEEDLKKLATLLGPIVSDGVIDRMDERGMFEPAPEPVQPPPHAEPAPTGQPDGEAVAPPSEPQQPHKRTLAERFFGS